jgi:hypothetical protein
LSNRNICLKLYYQLKWINSYHCIPIYKFQDFTSHHLMILHYIIHGAINVPLIIIHYYLKVLSILSIFPRVIMPFESYTSNLWFSLFNRRFNWYVTSFTWHILYFIQAQLSLILSTNVNLIHSSWSPNSDLKDRD